MGSSPSRRLIENAVFAPQEEYIGHVCSTLGRGHQAGSVLQYRPSSCKLNEAYTGPMSTPAGVIAYTEEPRCCPQENSVQYTSNFRTVRADESAPYAQENCPHAQNTERFQYASVELGHTTGGEVSAKNIIDGRENFGGGDVLVDDYEEAALLSQAWFYSNILPKIY